MTLAARFVRTGALPPFRHTLSERGTGHARPECLDRRRRGEWCNGIGNHPGRCKACPMRR